MGESTKRNRIIQVYKELSAQQKLMFSEEFNESWKEYLINDEPQNGTGIQRKSSKNEVKQKDKKEKVSDRKKHKKSEKSRSTQPKQQPETAKNKKSKSKNSKPTVDKSETDTVAINKLSST